MQASQRRTPGSRASSGTAVRSALGVVSVLGTGGAAGSAGLGVVEVLMTASMPGGLQVAAQFVKSV